MKLTKYQHACFTLEKDGQLLVVDPGGYTHDLGAPENVVAIVVTHEHPDHFDASALGAIIAHNPDATIYGLADIVNQLGDTLPNHAVTSGDIVNAGPFRLEFFGGEHADIPYMPHIHNLGVMIDDKLYYPGDSFDNPDRTVDTLALPAAAPWMKSAEAWEFLLAVKPRFVFPTHDAILSDAGKQLVDAMGPVVAEKAGATYQRLNEPVEI